MNEYIITWIVYLFLAWIFGIVCGSKLEECGLYKKPIISFFKKGSE